MSEKKRHFLVKGVKKDLCGFSGFQYPERGDVEAFDWNDKEGCSGGIFGIDSKSFKHDIRNEMYLIIEYNPDDGVVRSGKDKLKIRKGIVVYSSSDISKIQDWLEANGDCYRGYGASIKVGDNEDVSCGDKCTVIAGNGCKIKVGYRCYIISGNECTISCSTESYVKAGDNSKVEVSYCSTVSVGKNSKVCAEDGSTLSGGEGTLLSWEDDDGSFHHLVITEKESGKKYLGEWQIAQKEE